MSEITTGREEAAKQLASDSQKVWRDLRPTEKDEFRREAQKRIDRDGGVRIHESEDETDVAAYVGVSARETMGDIKALLAVANGEEVSEKGAELLDLDHDELQDSAVDHLYALPLAVERTVSFEIVLGVGGPDRRIIVECDAVSAGESHGETDLWAYEVRRIVFRYSWSGSAEVELSGDEKDAAEAFARQVVPELVE